jgi:hypothetical protein
VDLPPGSINQTAATSRLFGLSAQSAADTGQQIAATAPSDSLSNEIKRCAALWAAVVAPFIGRVNRRGGHGICRCGRHVDSPSLYGSGRCDGAGDNRADNPDCERTSYDPNVHLELSILDGEGRSTDGDMGPAP